MDNITIEQRKKFTAQSLSEIYHNVYTLKRVIPTKRKIKLGTLFIAAHGILKDGEIYVCMCTYRSPNKHYEEWFDLTDFQIYFSRHFI